ncbi:MAG: aldehyde dehydrogenase family protein, partial [Parvularculaceae bacterium]|nr:aldehyde dehydrogenase family protein [Parvularculaceae bacterium]
MTEIPHFIAGKRFAGSGEQLADVFDPSTGEVRRSVRLASENDVALAVEAAQAAAPAWSALNPQRRARVLFEFKRLVERDMDELANLLSSEHGKVVADSKGDIQRGLDVVEFACGAPHLLKGEFTENAGPGIDVFSMRQPLGVCAGITPFNFPAMIPCWMFAVSVACGNSFILKPSEKDP